MKDYIIPSLAIFAFIVIGYMLECYNINMNVNTPTYLFFNQEKFNLEMTYKKIIHSTERSIEIHYILTLTDA